MQLNLFSLFSQLFMVQYLARKCECVFYAQLVLFSKVCWGKEWRGVFTKQCFLCCSQLAANQRVFHCQVSPFTPSIRALSIISLQKTRACGLRSCFDPQICSPLTSLISLSHHTHSGSFPWHGIQSTYRLVNFQGVSLQYLRLNQVTMQAHFSDHSFYQQSQEPI